MDDSTVFARLHKVRSLNMRLSWINNAFISKELYAPFIIEKVLCLQQETMDIDKNTGGLEVFELLGNISAIITLLLFVSYVLGRIMMIISVKNIWKDRIILYKNDKEYNAYNIVDGVGKRDNPIHSLLIASEGLRDLKVYRVEYQYNEKKAVMEQVKKERIFSRGFLNIGEAIAIHEEPAELIPTLVFEYTAIDFTKVEFEWRSNLRNGVFSEVVRPKHTPISILFYLVK